MSLTFILGCRELITTKSKSNSHMWGCNYHSLENTAKKIQHRRKVNYIKIILLKVYLVKLSEPSSNFSEEDEKNS